MALSIEIKHWTTQKSALILLLLLSITACRDDDQGDQNALDVPDINELTPPDAVTDNQALRIQLGRMLFWDPVLSGEGDVACASCHHPNFAYADGRALSIGVGGEGLGAARIDASVDGIGLVKRNSPTILNTAFNGMNENGNFNPATAPMFWDNRTSSLEAQALEPLESFEEMRGHAYSEAETLPTIIQRLEEIPDYSQLFDAAFGDQGISSQTIGAAIAAFERTLIATDSPFDRFQAGDQNALTPAQRRGMDRFIDIGCADCHSGPMFSDYELHTLGIPDNPILGFSDDGINGDYAFRTPTLRNLSATGPYFHNGVARNLQEVVQFYRTARNPGNNGGGPGGGLNINPNVNGNQIDQDVRNLDNIDNDDIEDIVSFLRSLDDPNFDRTIPSSVPSGLNPGGNIN